MPNLIISPARLKLSPGTELPKLIDLTFVGSGFRPLSAYYILAYGESLWIVDTDHEGNFLIERKFHPHRLGDFTFEVSQFKDAPQGSSYIEANRAFRTEYVEPKPVPTWLRRLRELAQRQLARLIARGDA